MFDSDVFALQGLPSLESAAHGYVAASCTYTCPSQASCGSTCAVGEQ